MSELADKKHPYDIVIIGAGSTGLTAADFAVRRDTAGFVKLVHRRDGTLLCATVVAERAGEMIHEWIGRASFRASQRRRRRRAPSRFVSVRILGNAVVHWMGRGGT